MQQLAFTTHQGSHNMHHPFPSVCRFVCDELDGRAARTFNQASTFGAVLDMVTDRWVSNGCVAAGYGRSRWVKVVINRW